MHFTSVSQMHDDGMNQTKAITYTLRPNLNSKMSAHTVPLPSSAASLH